ncbi:MAG TPA: hypothetical protein VGA77_13095 [Propylenella sp.]
MNFATFERRTAARSAGRRPIGGLTGLIRSLRQRVAEVREHLARLYSERELRQKLEGVDDHLLRDMGLVRDGDRIERLECWTRDRAGSDPRPFARR